MPTPLPIDESLDTALSSTRYIGGVGCRIGRSAKGGRTFEWTGPLLACVVKPSAQRVGCSDQTFHPSVIIWAGIYIPLRSDGCANKRRFLVKVSREGRVLGVYLKEKKRISTFPVCRHCSGSSVQAEFGRLVLKTPFVEKLCSLLRKDGHCSDSQVARKGSPRLKSPRTQIYGYIGSLAVWLVHKEMFINF